MMFGANDFEVWEKKGLISLKQKNDLLWYKDNLSYKIIFKKFWDVEVLCKLFFVLLFGFSFLMNVISALNSKVAILWGLLWVISILFDVVAASINAFLYRQKNDCIMALIYLIFMVGVTGLGIYCVNKVSFAYYHFYLKDAMYHISVYTSAFIFSAFIGMLMLRRVLEYIDIRLFFGVLGSGVLVIFAFSGAEYLSYIFSHREFYPFIGIVSAMVLYCKILFPKQRIIQELDVLAEENLIDPKQKEQLFQLSNIRRYWAACAFSIVWGSLTVGGILITYFN